MTTPIPTLARTNTGTPAPAQRALPNQLSFDAYPTNPRAIFPIGGGLPGVTYAIVLAERQHLFMQRGFVRLAEPLMVLIGGVPHEVLCAGEPIPAAPPQATRARLYLDVASPERTGLPPPKGWEPVTPTPPKEKPHGGTRPSQPAS